MARPKDSKGSKKVKSNGSNKTQSTPTQSKTPVEINYEPTKDSTETVETVDPLTTATMMVKALILLGCGCLINISIQLALNPLYGSAPLARNYRAIALAGPVLSGFVPDLSPTSPQWNEKSVMSFLGILTLLDPLMCFYVGAWTARLGSVSLGPAITLTAISLPSSILSIMLIKYFLVRCMFS